MTTRREFLKTAACAPLIGMPTFASEMPGQSDRNDHSDYLRSLCEEGLRRRYANQPDKCQNGSLSKTVQERLDAELRLINGLDLVKSFLILWETVRNARKNNALVSVRGSANGSLVVYALGVSRVCPLKHGLLFERFLDSSRPEPPEFLIALCQKAREDAISFLQQHHAELGVKVKYWELPINNDTPAPTITGALHAVFVQPPVLIVLRRTTQLISQRHNATIDLEQVPENDARTFALLQRGDTEGVFQFDDADIRDILRRLKPDTIQDLIATVAMYRPGPLQAGMVDAYIDRKHGREKVAYVHPIQEEILGETHGVMPYQEQALELFNRLGGIERSQGYKLLKAISMKKQAIINTHQERFMAGARERGIEEKEAASMYFGMVCFGGCCFCKAHATAEAWLAYQTAYLKAHYPEEFGRASTNHAR